jgi:hypothetical protein
MDPVPDPGFDDQKVKKKLQLEQIAIYLSLGLYKGRPNYRRSLHHSKENIQHPQTGNFCTYFLFF